MGKRFQLNFNIPSFQICRSKKLSSFPGNPVPAIYRLSPVNPKVQDIGYPNAPSTPPSKITSIVRGCQMCRDKEKRVKSRGRKSTSSVPSRRSDFAIDNINEEESETLISCLTSFSDEFCHDEKGFQWQAEEKDKQREEGSESEVSEFGESKRSGNGAGEEEDGDGKGVDGDTEKYGGKVRESFAVVKKSNDPYEDFKKSMMEMITEMEMSEAEDLEQLLQCFLALNSRSYHAVIVRAFMEIWQQMFIWNPTSIKNLQMDVKSDQK